MDVLILGSKEYPVGINKGYDLPSGGMEVYVENLVNHLRKYFKIKIISAWFPGSKKYEKEGNVEIYRIKRIPGKIIRGLTFPMFSFFKAIPMRFDIVIANGPVTTFFAYVLARLKGKRIIAIPHGIASSQKEHPLIVRLLVKYLAEKFAYKRVDALVFLSKSEMKDYIKRFGRPKNPVVIEQGIDLSKFKLKRRKKGKEKVILFVGRLVRVKGVEYLIRSLKYLDVPYVCYIVGDGPERKMLEKLAKDLDVNVKFFGFRTDVEIFLSEADVFVLPSLSEGFPITVLEAMAARVPVVITKLNLPLTDKEVMFVRKKDPKDIARGIRKVLIDKGLRQRLVKNAYNFAKKHSFESVALKYRELIEKLSKEQR